MFQSTHMRRLLSTILMVVALPASLFAQAGKRAVLSGEDPLLPMRLAAVERLLDPLGTPDMLGKNLGYATAPLGWLPALTASTAERNTPGRWQQVLDEYERLLRTGADVLVPLPGSPFVSAVSSVQARRLAHERLARLPPSLLEALRRRIDGQALRLLREGQANRDPVLLRKLVDELFCSQSAEHAADLLGDLAFERGQFAEALHWWSLVIGPSSFVNGQRTHDKGPTAKQILARAFLGQTAEADRDFQAFRKRHGQARGTLAGKTGVLADLLADIIDGPGDLFRPEPTWETFAGSVHRQHVLTAALSPRLWAEGPTWQLRLPGVEDANTTSPKGLGRHPQPACHPIIVDDQVVLASSSAVFGHDLFTGKLLWSYRLKTLEKPGAAEAKKSRRPAPHCTLSACGGRLFVRLRPTPGDDKAALENEGESHIVCLDLHPQGDGKRELWRMSSRWPTVFAGAPLAVEDRVYVAVTTMANDRAQTSLACFDAVTGRRQWLREVCESALTFSGAENLLTLTGGQLVFCSNSGVVAAVDPWSGRRLWGVRYPPHRFGEPGPKSRGLVPCVFHLDRLYVAPEDSDTLLCLNPANGAVIWERTGIEVVHLLGVVKERLFLCTPDGLRSIHAGTGTDEGGWQQPALGKLSSLGRGLLMGDWILWPTQDPLLPIRAVCQTDGSQTGCQDGTDGKFYEPTQLRRVLAGNMAFAHGCLVVAGSEELAVYVGPRRLRGKRAD